MDVTPQQTSALKLARRGFRVFRLAPGAKAAFLDRDWTNEATSDPLEVLERWTETPTANIGVLTSGLVVLDVDTKHGKAGLAELEALGQLPETFTVETPTGGRHVYFKGDGYGQAPITPAIDIRATNGYVVGPGSEIGGRPYVVIDAHDAAPLPESIAARLKEARTRAAMGVEVLGELDKPDALREAARWLAQGAPIAIEGERGNETTYRVSARVLDLGVSPVAAVELMGAHWNERCLPPWDGDDLARIVGHAATYRQNAIGHAVANAGAGFAPVPVDFDMPAIFSSFAPYLDTAETDRAIEPRDWIAKGKLLRSSLSSLVAPGSIGKSLLSLQWAFALARGDGGFTGLNVVGGPKRVMVINCEDGEDEQHRRRAAMAQHFGFSREDMHKRIYFWTDEARSFKVAVRDAKSRALVETGDAKAITEVIEKLGIDVLIVDPLIETHDANENDNGEVQDVMAIYRRIARTTGCAVLLIHHTRKLPQQDSASYAGNMDSGRGASASVNAVRFGFTLFTMSKADGEALGVAPEIRHRYVRLDDAKMNYGLASPFAQWFRRTTVKLPCGEDMGVLVPEDLKARAEQQKQSADQHLAPSIARLIGEGVNSLTAVARGLLDGGELGTISRHQAAARVREAVASGLVVQGRRIVIEPNGATGGTLSLATI